MARISEDQPLVASILDRLIDDDPGNSREPPKSRGQVLRELKNSVRRDLEDLLNTRWRCESWPVNLQELEFSLANYGIPDFTGLNMGSRENRDELRHTVEEVIRRFEPRFQRVKVSLQQNADPQDRTLRLRIDALLHAEPAPEPVVFDSQLEPLNGIFEVKSDTP